MPRVRRTPSDEVGPPPPRCPGFRGGPLARPPRLLRVLVTCSKNLAESRIPPQPAWRNFGGAPLCPAGFHPSKVRVGSGRAPRIVPPSQREFVSKSWGSSPASAVESRPGSRPPEAPPWPSRPGDSGALGVSPEGSPGGPLEGPSRGGCPRPRSPGRDGAIAMGCGDGARGGEGDLGLPQAAACELPQAAVCGLEARGFSEARRVAWAGRVEARGRVL